MIHTPKIRKNSYKNSGKILPKKTRTNPLGQRRRNMEIMEREFVKAFGHTPTLEWIERGSNLNILQFEKPEQLEHAMVAFINNFVRILCPWGTFYYDKPIGKTKGRLILSLNP